MVNDTPSLSPAHPPIILTFDLLLFLFLLIILPVFNQMIFLFFLSEGRFESTLSEIQRFLL